jgi:hypothetical protein
MLPNISSREKELEDKYLKLTKAYWAALKKIGVLTMMLEKYKEKDDEKCNGL